jgi:hypothetical protein
MEIVCNFTSGFRGSGLKACLQQGGFEMFEEFEELTIKLN